MIKAERSSHDRNPRLICALVFQRKFTSFAAWIFQNRSTLQCKVLLSSTISHDGATLWKKKVFHRKILFQKASEIQTICYVSNYRTCGFSLLFAYPWRSLLESSLLHRRKSDSIFERLTGRVTIIYLVQIKYRHFLNGK